MAYQTGTANDHFDLFNILRTFVATQGWVELEHSANDYVLWEAPGLSGTEEIYCGINVYQSIPDDVYNFEFGAYTGYIPGNTFYTQPNAITGYVTPLYNQPIPYWAVCNGQRLTVVCNIQNTDVTFYIGKFLPYSTPSQYPYPMVVGAMFNTYGTTNSWRYSSTAQAYVCPYKGYHNRSPTATNYQSTIAIRDLANNWTWVSCWPSMNGSPTTPTYTNYIQLRNTNNSDGTASGDYGLYPIILTDISTYELDDIASEYNGYITGGNVYGELDGVFKISGYNNATQNIVTINSVPYLVFRDRTLTAIHDYFALRLQ
jgi:hypothetical protein